MSSLNGILLRRLRQKHAKLSSRFLKNVEEGCFQELSKRKRYTIVERIKRYERQLRDFGKRSGSTPSIQFKHWAVALALGVVVTTASAQKQEDKGFIDKLKHRANTHQSARKGINNKTEAQTIFFTQVQQLGLPYPQNIFPGDMDGDGDIDAVYIAYLGHPIIFRNEGGFSFTQTEITTEELYIISSSAVADFDGDGDLDVLLQYGPYGVTPEIAVWLNDGIGGFTKQPATSYLYIDDDLIVSDLDGDGDADMVIVNESSYIKLLMNNNLDFIAAPGAPLMGDYGGQHRALAVADFDGDLDIDIVFRGYDGSFNDGIRLFINDGSGTFTDAGSHIIFANNSGESQAADFDNDGDMDFVIVTDSYPNAEITAFLNNGSGVFTPQTPVSVLNGRYPNLLSTPDLNNDTFDDIVFSSESDSTFVMQGDGLGGFTLRDKFPGQSISGNFDADADTDFIVFDRNIAIVENQGSFSFVKNPNDIVTVSVSYDLDIVDVDGDGDLDIVQGGFSRVWLNDGSGQNFTISQEITVGSEQQIFKDLDGDGDFDMVRSSDSDLNYPGLDIWLNSGGVFTYNSNIGQGLFDVRGFELGDLDGDSEIDIISLVRTGSSAYYLKTFINQGALSFVELSNVDISPNDASQLSLGDVDGDLDIDAVIANGTSGFAVVSNDGTGDMTVGTIFTPLGVNFDIADVDLADLDGDGNLDVFASNGYDDPAAESYVFINDGLGVFTDSGQNVASSINYSSSLADLDGDGDTDLITTVYFSSSSVWINDGSANFSLDHSLGGISDEYTKPVIDDLDNDGDMDIVMGGAYGPTLIFLNDLNGSDPILADSLALVDFYDATAGDSWTEATNWKTGDIDTWFGVTVTTDRVTDIDLPNNNIDGVIPASFNNLTALETLNLNGNGISGFGSNLSGLTNLSNADLSNNNLDFGDFELIGSLPGLVVGAQTTTDTPLDVEIPAGNPVSFSFQVDGTGNTYQWFKNGNSLADSTRNEIVIEAISRENQGIYYCEARNGALPGLVLTSAIKSALGTVTVDGRLLVNDTDPATKGEMLLLEVKATNGYDSLGPVAINDMGEFSFGNVVMRDYLLVGIADTIEHQNALPTYYTKTAFWAEADTIFLTDNLNVDLVSVFYTNPSNDVGRFSGYLEEELNDGGRIDARGRVSGAGVAMRRGKNLGRLEGSGELAYYVYTDENGEFLIRGVEPGEYNVDIQYPGYPMDKDSFLDITIGGGPKDKEVSVEAVVIDGLITVRQLIILSTDKPTNGLLLYPNPTAEVLKIVDAEKRDNLLVEIYDMSGAKLKLVTFDKEVNIKVTDLPIGQYLVKVLDKKGGELLTQRILIE